MNLTGAAKEAFEKWLLSNDLYYIVQYNTDVVAFDMSETTKNEVEFYRLSFSMKWGVYVDWFDSVGLHLTVDCIGIEHWRCCINLNRDYNMHFTWLNHGSVNTRHEARTEAIKKANELFNNK